MSLAQSSGWGLKATYECPKTVPVTELLALSPSPDYQAILIFYLYASAPSFSLRVHFQEVLLPPSPSFLSLETSNLHFMAATASESKAPIQPFPSLDLQGPVHSPLLPSPSHSWPTPKPSQTFQLPKGYRIFTSFLPIPYL